MLFVPATALPPPDLRFAAAADQGVTQIQIDRVFMENKFEMDPYEELKIVQDVITTQEELCFRVYSWAAGFITALTIGFFHERVDIPTLIYSIVGIVIVIGFYIVGRHHWHTFSSAVVRSRQIEDAINDGSYSKFRMNSVLKDDKCIEYFGGYKLWAPYLVLLLIVLVCSSSSFLSRLTICVTS